MKAEWISVKDKLPPEGEGVLCAIEIADGFDFYGEIHETDIACMDGDEPEPFTHHLSSHNWRVWYWMLIPEIPAQRRAASVFISALPCAEDISSAADWELLKWDEVKLLPSLQKQQTCGFLGSIRILSPHLQTSESHKGSAKKLMEIGAPNYSHSHAVKVIWWPDGGTEYLRGPIAGPIKYLQNPGSIRMDRYEMRLNEAPFTVQPKE